MFSFHRLGHRSNKNLPPSFLLGIFFIFTFSKIDKSKSSLLCCFKKHKKNAVYDEPHEEIASRETPNSASSLNVCFSERRNCFTLGGKRNCELPPVPIVAANVPNINLENFATATRYFADDYGGDVCDIQLLLRRLRTRTKAKNQASAAEDLSDLEAPISLSFFIRYLTGKIYRYLVFTGLKTMAIFKIDPFFRPKPPLRSTCLSLMTAIHLLPRMPANRETELVVGSRQVDVLDGIHPYSFCEPSESDPLYASVGIPGVSATPRNRPEASASTAVAVAANSIVPPPTEKLDFWNGVDSEGSAGSMALPYYSSILHDPNQSSPVYQEAPVVQNSQSPAVYAQVKTPPTSKSIRLRSTEYYASPNCSRSNGVVLGVYRRAVKSQGNSDMVAGPPVPSRAYRLSEIEQLLNTHQSMSNQIAAPEGGSQVNHRAPRRPRSEANSRGLNLWEIFHSGLRRRQNNGQDQVANGASVNETPSNEPPVPIEPPIVPRVSGDYSSSTYGSAKSGHYRNITVRESIASLRARNALPTFLSENRRPVEMPSETDYEGVYWYPDENNAEVSNERASRSSFGSQGVAEPVTDLGSDAYVEIPDRPRREDVYAEPSENPHAPTPPPAVRNYNVTRILLEMQGFRYADSETDLSSSVTPPEIGEGADVKEWTEPVTNGGDVAMMPSTSASNPPKLRRPEVPAARTKARKSLNMTPLIERSMEVEFSRSPPRSPSSSNHQSKQRPASRPLPEVAPSHLITVHSVRRVGIASCKMWLLNILGIVIHFSLCNSVLSNTKSELLEFASVDGANSEENVYLTDSSPEVLMDATSRITRSIYFLGSTNLVTHVVRFSCEVDSRSTPLVDVKICCITSGKNQACHRLSAQPSVGKITCNRIQFDYVFNKFHGANFSLKFQPIREHSFPYNEQIYCEIEDSDSTIQSNIIEFRDAIFYATQLGVQTSNAVEKYEPAEISPRDFPLKFSCGDYASKMREWPSWMAAVWQQYLSPFEWAFCSVGESTTSAGCAKNRQTLGLGDSVTTMDGTLILLSDTVLEKNPNSAFLCLHRGSSLQPIRAYASEFIPQTTPSITKGFTLNRDAPPSQIIGFAAISPSETSYQFTEGMTLSDFKLQAFYRVPEFAKANLRYGWYKDGRKLTDPEATANSFRLPNKVERSFGGIYELRVMEGASQRLKFTFNVSVVGAPTFKDVDCIEDLFYALEGTAKRYTCELNAGESDKVTFKVGINGFEADSAEGLRKILGSSLQLQNQPIERLDIDFWLSSRDTKGISVEVKNLEIGQNFRISVKAVNAYGQSLVSGTLRVVPKPALSLAPSRLSCSADCGEDPFDVQCVPSPAVSDQWYNLKIIHQQGWVLARTYIIETLEDPDIMKFFAFNVSNPAIIKVSPYIPIADLVKVSDLPTTVTTVSTGSTPDGASTNMYTSASPTRETLQEVLSEKLSRPISDLQLECRFQLFVNNSRAKFIVYDLESAASGASMRKRREIIDKQKKIYDSFNEEDPTLKETLTVSRPFSEVSKPTAASFAWIAAVIIAIIFILIVITIAVWLCTRNRGETYKLSKKEYKLGNDPIRELKEKETFQAYERPEEPPSLASGMEEPDLEVGSDEDGELDAYNMDPGTFNEEASFIGQYSSPARNSGYPEHHTAV
ncbi:hypothetical protein Aperf_G00000105684 [Anoplocephala perfoliata]